MTASSLYCLSQSVCESVCQCCVTTLPHVLSLQVIVMSATLDAGKFQEYFAGAPLVKVCVN